MIGPESCLEAPSMVGTPSCTEGAKRTWPGPLGSAPTRQGSKTGNAVRSVEEEAGMGRREARDRGSASPAAPQPNCSSGHA